jgi:hypothetical protein
MLMGYQIEGVTTSASFHTQHTRVITVQLSEALQRGNYLPIA